MKNLFLVILLCVTCYVLCVNTAQAYYNCGQPIVPCGTSVEDVDCTICHFFEGFARIAQFVAFCLAPPFAVLMFLIGGLILSTAGGSQERMGLGKKILLKIIQYLGEIILLKQYQVHIY